jgi:hypothetical protein
MNMKNRLIATAGLAALATLSTTPTAIATPSGYATVTLEGRTPYVGDQNACDTIKQGEAVEILIEDRPGTRLPKASVEVSSGDVPQVFQLLINDGTTGYIYDRSTPGAGGPVYALKNGNSYTITGTVVNSRVVPKRFEINVTCP